MKSIVLCAVALGLVAVVAASSEELEGHATRFPGMKVFYPNAFLQEGAGDDPPASATGNGLPTGANIYGLPKNHACVCMDMPAGGASPVAGEMELLQLESKSRSEEQTATGKKVKMMCYCGAQKSNTGAAAGEGFDTPYNPPAKVGYLRPFTHRLFDRRFGLPEKVQSWGEQKKSKQDAHNEHDTRFSDETNLPEKWKTAAFQKGAKANAKDSVFYDKRFGPPLQALRGAKKDGWYYALYPRDGDVGARYGGDQTKDVLGDDAGGEGLQKTNCKNQEQKHPKLYNMMKDFFGGKMTADQCKFWRDYIGQMNKELGVSLTASQIRTMGALMHCVC